MTGIIGHDQGRLTVPMMGKARVSWNTALTTIARKFEEVMRAHGPDAIAFHLSGQFLTEDYYVANKLMKGFIGSANINMDVSDSIAPVITGHMRAFGEDAMPGCHDDIDEADLLVFIATDAASDYPVLFERALAARTRRGAKIVVIGQGGAGADLHLPLVPGMETALFNMLLAELPLRGMIAPEFVVRHTAGLDTALLIAAANRVSADDLGLDAGLLETFANWFCETEHTVTLYAGDDADRVNAIINVHLATGRISRAGMGPLPLTNQLNAMGGRDVGAFPNQLAAHLRFDNAEDRALLKDFWLAPRLAEKPGLNAEQLFGAVLAGKVKALWIAGTDPVENLPHGDRVRAALEICPLVVATDCWIKETIMRADIVLPAAAWGEKTGTVTNAERVISPRKRCRNAPGDAMPEWWMFTELAKRMGFADAFHYHAPADIFREHAALSGFGNGGRRVFDIGSLANISDTTYETLQPVRWPQPVGRPSPARLFGKGGFPVEDGRARIVPLVVKLPGKTNTAHPFRLASTQVGAEPILRISPSDATMLGLSRDDLVRVATRHANTLLPVEIAAEQGLGEVAAAMGAQHPAEAVGRLLGMKRGAAAGAKQEFAAVARVPAYWHGVMLSRESLVPAGRFFWSRCTAGEGLHQFRLIGWKQMVNNKPLDWAARLCGMKDNDERIELSDPAQGVYRLAIVSKGALVTILFIAPTSGQLPSPVTLQALFARGDAFPRRFEILHGALNKSRHDQNVGGVYSENYQREGKIS